MQFVNAITRTPGEVAKVHRLWQEGGDPRNPFAHLLTTPVGSTDGQLRAVRALVDRAGARMTFDSGGFYVQIGRLSYDALYGQLLDAYRAQPWADWYVLPDWVPRSTDPEDLVWEKVRYMVRTCRLFLRDLHILTGCLLSFTSIKMRDNNRAERLNKKWVAARRT